MKTDLLSLDACDFTSADRVCIGRIIPDYG